MSQLAGDGAAEVGWESGCELGSFSMAQTSAKGEVKMENQMDSGESLSKKGVLATLCMGVVGKERGTSPEGYIQSKAHPGRGAEKQLHTDIRLLGHCGSSDKEDETGSLLHSSPTKNTQNSPVLPFGLRVPY